MSNRLLETVLIIISLVVGQTAGAANYAKAPRFNSLIYYDDKAEEAHVDFARQAVAFSHKLSYGEGFTYSVTTSLSEYKGSLEAFDIVVCERYNYQRRFPCCMD